MPKTKAERRSGTDQRQFSYTVHVPERRSGKDRRCEEDNIKSDHAKKKAGVNRKLF